MRLKVSQSTGGRIRRRVFRFNFANIANAFRLFRSRPLRQKLFCEYCEAFSGISKRDRISLGDSRTRLEDHRRRRSRIGTRPTAALENPYFHSQYSQNASGFLFGGSLRGRGLRKRSNTIRNIRKMRTGYLVGGSLRGHGRREPSNSIRNIRKIKNAPLAPFSILRILRMVFRLRHERYDDPE